MERKPCLRSNVSENAQRAEQTLSLQGKLVGTPECYALLEDTRARVQQGLKHVVIDMHEVDLVNSAGAGIIAALLTSTQRQGGKLILVGMQDRTRRVLEFMQLHRFAVFCDNLAEARAAES